MFLVQHVLTKFFWWSTYESFPDAADGVATAWHIRNCAAVVGR
jgi:hypothetical protein